MAPEFSLRNDDAQHHHYAKDFNEAVNLCETICSVSGEEWEEVKDSNDIYQIEMYMRERGYKAEVMG
mgnify:CR=1 FL=1